MSDDASSGDRVQVARVLPEVEVYPHFQIRGAALIGHLIKSPDLHSRILRRLRRAGLDLERGAKTEPQRLAVTAPASDA